MSMLTADRQSKNSLHPRIPNELQDVEQQTELILLRQNEVVSQLEANGLIAKKGEPTPEALEYRWRLAYTQATRDLIDENRKHQRRTIPIPDIQDERASEAYRAVPVELDSGEEAIRDRLLRLANLSLEHRNHVLLRTIMHTDNCSNDEIVVWVGALGLTNEDFNTFAGIAIAYPLKVASAAAVALGFAEQFASFSAATILTPTTQRKRRSDAKQEIEETLQIRQKGVAHVHPKKARSGYDGHL